MTALIGSDEWMKGYVLAMPRTLAAPSLAVLSKCIGWRSTAPCSSSHALLLPSLVQVQQTWDALPLHLSSSGVSSQEVASRALGLVLAGQLEQVLEDEHSGNFLTEEGTVLERVVCPSVESLNRVMEAYREQGRLDEGLKVWESFKQMSVVPNLESYSIVIDMFRSRKDARSAVRVYRNARQQFLGVNSTGIFHQTCRLDLEGLESSSQTEVAEIVDEKRNKSAAQDVEAGDEAAGHELADSAKPQVEVVASPETQERIDEMASVVLELCMEKLNTGVEGDENRFVLQNLLQKMQYARLPMEKFACRRLLLKCGEKKDDYVVLRCLYKYMSEKRMLTTTLCNHSIKTYGYHGKWWSALDVLETMQSSGCKPNSLTFKLLRSQFTYLLSAAKRKRTWKWCLQLMEKMEEKGVRPGKEAWDLALVTCARAGKTEETVELFQKMIQWRYKPDIHSFGALLSALEKQALVKDMERVLVTMKNSGVVPTESIYTTLIAAYGKQRNLVEITRLVNEMEAAGIRLSVATFNSIITACATAGDAQAAVRWMEKLESTGGIKANSITYNKLVEALAAGNRWREAVSTYIYMVDMKMEPSPWAYDAIARVCRLNNIEMEHRWIGKRPKQLRAIDFSNVNKFLVE